MQLPIVQMGIFRDTCLHLKSGTNSETHSNSVPSTKFKGEVKNIHKGNAKAINCMHELTVRL